MANRLFFRYTQLPSLIHVLRTRQLTLLDPMSWDDKNDSGFLKFYKDKLQLKSLLALCFTLQDETYHHWRIFSPHSSGVRITFQEHLLRKSIAKIKDLKFRKVKYLKIRNIRSQQPDFKELPFIKRYPYKPENEYRLLWQSLTDVRRSIGVPIDLQAIARITLSPWLDSSLVDSVKHTLKGIDGCSSLKVYHTTLKSNDEWLKYGAAATQRAQS